MVRPRDYCVFLTARQSPKAWDPGANAGTASTAPHPKGRFVEGAESWASRASFAPETTPTHCGPTQVTPQLPWRPGMRGDKNGIPLEIPFRKRLPHDDPKAVENGIEPTAP